MDSENEFRFRSRSFALGVATGFALALGGVLLMSFLVSRDMAAEVSTGQTPPPAASLGAPDFPASPSSKYGEVPADWALRSTASSDTTTFEKVAARGSGPLVVNVWATWCQPCRSELPTLQALHDSTGTVVLVSDEPRDEVRAFLDRAGHDMPAYVAGQWPSVLEGQAVPRTFVVDGNGQVIYRHVGAADWGSAPTYAFLRRLREQGGPS